MAPSAVRSEAVVMLLLTHLCIVASMVYGVCVWSSSTKCPFYSCNHFAEKEGAWCFLIVFLR